MSAELPFPIAFTLPEGWMLVAPESCGHPEAAYVAVRQHDAAAPIATNIVVNGFVIESGLVDVAALADSYPEKMRSQYPVAVLKRDVMAGNPPTEAAQLLEIEFPVGDTTVTVKQVHILNAFAGVQDPSATAVLQLLLTCPTGLFDRAGPEFTRFVATITPLASQNPVQ